MSKTIYYTDFTHIDTPKEERRKLDVGDIYMNVAVHTPCGWIMRSKNRHDYVTCKCGEASIDGGSWYQKITGDNVVSHCVMYTDREK